MTREEMTLRMIVVRVLKDILAEADNGDREDARTTWTVGDRLGATLGGQVAGHAQLRKATTRATIGDAGAFEAWVSANRPSEIEFLSSVRVRPAYQAAVLAAAKKTGVAVTADGEEIPGVTVAEGEPTLAVLPADNAAELVAAAWQSGELWELLGNLLPVLEAAPHPPISEAS